MLNTYGETVTGCVESAHRDECPECQNEHGKLYRAMGILETYSCPECKAVWHATRQSGSDRILSRQRGHICHAWTRKVVK